jgi:RimJ/RimL family protein N-acetyltransferase
MIVGRKVRLRRPENRGRDQETIVAWRNDAWIKGFFFEEEPISLDSHLAWYDKVAADSSQRYYVIDALVQPGTPPTRLVPPLMIGVTSLLHIDWRNRTAEYGRLLLGHADYRGGGYGKEAEYLLMDYAFNYLNLNKVWGDVIAGNEVVLNLHRRMGFKEEGILRQQVFKGGRYLDVVKVGLLAETFRGLQPQLRRALGLPQGSAF